MISAKKLIYKLCEQYSDIKTTVDEVPKIYISTATPTSTDGENGDVWIVYTAS